MPSESAQYFGEFTVLSDMSQHQISLRFVSLLLVDALTSCNTTTLHFCAHDNGAHAPIRSNAIRAVSKDAGRRFIATNSQLRYRAAFVSQPPKNIFGEHEFIRARRQLQIPFESADITESKIQSQPCSADSLCYLFGRVCFTRTIFIISLHIFFITF